MGCEVLPYAYWWEWCYPLSLAPIIHHRGPHSSWQLPVLASVAGDTRTAAANVSHEWCQPSLGLHQKHLPFWSSNSVCQRKWGRIRWISAASFKVFPWTRPSQKGGLGLSPQMDRWISGHAEILFQPNVSCMSGIMTKKNSSKLAWCDFEYHHPII